LTTRLKYDIIKSKKLRKERNMFLILCGKSGSGKDKILNELVNKHNYESIVSYTTRPMRDGEMEGREYN
jgi:guanylate kinase